MNNNKSNKSKTKNNKSVINEFKNLSDQKKAGVVIICIAIITLIISLCSFSSLFNGIDYGNNSSNIISGSGLNAEVGMKISNEKAKEIFDSVYYSDLTLLAQTITHGTTWLELCSNSFIEIDGEYYTKVCDKLYNSVASVKETYKNIALDSYIDNVMGKDYLDYENSLYVRAYNDNVDEEYIEMDSYKILNSSSNEISYLVTSKYGKLGCDSACKYSYKEHKLTLVNENGKWLISEFEMPY